MLSPESRRFYGSHASPIVTLSVHSSGHASGILYVHSSIVKAHDFALLILAGETPTPRNTQQPGLFSKAKTGYIAETFSVQLSLGSAGVGSR